MKTRCRLSAFICVHRRPIGDFFRLLTVAARIGVATVRARFAGGDRPQKAMACPTLGFGFQRTIRDALGWQAEACPTHAAVTNRRAVVNLPHMDGTALCYLVPAAVARHCGGGGGARFAADYVWGWLEAAASDGQLHGGEGAIAGQ